LDEHISPAVARAAERRCAGIEVTPLRQWETGHWLSAPDDLILDEARKQGLTFVTYDLRTIPPLLRAWAEQGLGHGGVILVDNHTIPQNDIGALARALCEVWRLERNLDWADRIIFLRATK